MNFYLYYSIISTIVVMSLMALIWHFQRPRLKEPTQPDTYKSYMDRFFELYPDGNQDQYEAWVRHWFSGRLIGLEDGGDWNAILAIREIWKNDMDIITSPHLNSYVKTQKAPHSVEGFLSWYRNTVGVSFRKASSSKV